MSEDREDPEVFWVDPTLRGIIPLNGFHISKSLSRRLKSGIFRPQINSDFEGVIQGCADRPETWINETIHGLFTTLHAQGHAHSLEIWYGSRLVGGVYGLSLGTAFFGESMFSRETDASKVALAYLVDRLRVGGFTLFDVQFLTPHLESLGAVEIPRKTYRDRLGQALQDKADFRDAGPLPDPQTLLQRMTQTS